MSSDDLDLIKRDNYFKPAFRCCVHIPDNNDITSLLYLCEIYLIFQIFNSSYMIIIIKINLSLIILYFIF